LAAKRTKKQLQELIKPYGFLKIGKIISDGKNSKENHPPDNFLFQTVYHLICENRDKR
jgi:hypothetical protein